MPQSFLSEIQLVFVMALFPPLIHLQENLVPKWLVRVIRERRGIRAPVLRNTQMKWELLTGGFGAWGRYSCRFRVRDPAGLGCLTVSHLHQQSSKPCQISEGKYLVLLRELQPKDFSKGNYLNCKPSWQILPLETAMLDTGKTEEII